VQAEDLRRWQRQTPFRPFRLFLTDGQSYEVRHPEVLLVTKRYASIGLPVAGTPDDIPERVAEIDLFHVVGVEPLEVPASPHPNGGGS
jgi:hypothetical protein